MHLPSLGHSCCSRRSGYMLAAIWAARESGPLPVVEAPPPTDGVPSTNEDAAVLHGRSVAALAGEEASAVRGEVSGRRQRPAEKM